MNSILGQVTTHSPQAGQRIVIAAQEKIGKTTLACQAPNVLHIRMEIDNSGIAVPHTPMITSWEMVEQLCLELIDSAKRGQLKRGSSLAWDSGTALERLIHDFILRKDKRYVHPNNAGGLTMEAALEGFGKAYAYANELFGRWTRYMDELSIYGGINIIVTCHVFASKVIDPAHGEYNSWDLQLHSPKNEKTYGKREYMTQWADLIGFLHEPVFVQKAEEGSKMNRAVSAGQGHMLAVSRAPGWVAGNRYGLTGLIPMPANNGWNWLADAIYRNRGIDIYNRSLPQ